VRGGIAFGQIVRMADHLDAAGRPGEHQRNIEGDGHTGADVDVTLERVEPLRIDGDMVRVRRQVAEGELASSIRGRRSREAGDRVADFDLDRLHHAAGGIFDGALDRPGAAQALRPRARHSDRAHSDRDLKCHRENL
jgi:hypothetical protein